MNETTKSRAPLRALPVGRILRFLLGAVVVVAVWPFLRNAASSRALGAAFVVVGLTVLYGLVHWLVSSYLPRLNCWLGACLAILPLLLVFFFGGTPGQIGALSFLAASLLVAAIRADAGCEVMSIPSLVSGRRTHLMCLLFSPLDWVEKEIVGGLRTPPARF